MYIYIERDIEVSTCVETIETSFLKSVLFGVPCYLDHCSVLEANVVHLVFHFSVVYMHAYMYRYTRLSYMVYMCVDTHMLT